MVSRLEHMVAATQQKDLADLERRRAALEEDGVPDIAIEVVVTSGLVDKMAVYAGLGVPEVWLWRP